MKRHYALARPFPVACSLILAACQLPSENPPATPEQPSPSTQEPPPLPPEETPPEPEPPPATAPAPEAKPIEPGIAPTGAPTRGKLPQAVVDEKLASVTPAIQACYQRALQTAPALRGNVSIDFVVAPDGKVAHAQAMEVDDPLDDAATLDCIVAEIRKLEFPKPSGGRVFLTYPLKLEAPPAKGP